MTMQEARLGATADPTAAETSQAALKISLVVDIPSPDSRSLLILPFAAVEPEGHLGRQMGLLLQRRFAVIPDLAVGHGQLITPGARGRGRRYLPLGRPLSAEQARACGAGWGATTVLYGAISAQDGLRWTLIVQDVRGGDILFNDTLIGDIEDMPDAPGSAAEVIARALEIGLNEQQQEALVARETDSPEALISFLQATDLRPQYGLSPSGLIGMRRHLLQALRLDPSFEAARTLLVTDMQATKDEAQLLENLLQAAGGGREGLESLAALARMLEERGCPDPARTLAAAVLTREPRQETALSVAARGAFAAGAFAGARALVDTWLEVRSDDPAAHELRGNLLAAGGRFVGAAQHWELALEYDPSRSRLLMRLGVYLAVSGDYERAYETLLRAREQGAASMDALFQFGRVAYRLGHYEEGRRALELALEKNPNRAQLHALLARCYLRLGREDRALAHDRQALKLAPTLWPSALATGHLTLNSGDLDEALTAFTTAARLRPDSADALCGLGSTLVARGFLDDGIAVLLRAHELRPADIEILSTLALAYYQAGNRKEADLVLAQGYRLAPESDLLRRCRAVMLR